MHLILCQKRRLGRICFFLPDICRPNYTVYSAGYCRIIRKYFAGCRKISSWINPACQISGPIGGCEETFGKLKNLFFIFYFLLDSIPRMGESRILMILVQVVKVNDNSFNPACFSRTRILQPAINSYL